ncbi:MAG: ribonuclease J [Deltaproteobacteria bacterium]|nr:ribonuclease J [Deltaproteobacteria bacterium]MBN2671367.1 ribonuclease J [Deltaproteobacteria bacterium]
MSNNAHSLRIVPLGGFGEIGMNCLAIETHDELLIVDCGVQFPSEPRLGVDVIHASFEYLLSKRDKIAGLVATHGHEDHIAAIPFLLEQLSIPIFAGPYTVALLQSRLQEFPRLRKIQFNVIENALPFHVHNFIITPIRMPHSTVDNFALLIETPAQNNHSGYRIFHTSDFKLNVKHPTDNADILSTLRALQPVDLMITDSTGSLEQEDAGDEDTLIEHLEELIVDAPGRVFIALFSSNIERIRNLIKIAEHTGRHISLSGRSVLNHYRIARETGDIPSTAPVLIPEQSAHHLNDTELIVLLSGTQGESRSALGRFASGKHSQFTPISTDTVILSSRFIPGNELQISRTISRLVEQQVQVFHRNNWQRIHVSGHGSKNEILAAMNAVSPRALLPAHGTFEHLQATANLAKEAQIPSTVTATNGDVISLTDGILTIDEKIAHGKIFIENNRPLPEAQVRERHRISNHGTYVIWASLCKRVSPPSILIRQHTLGVVPESGKESLFHSVEQIIQDTIQQISVRKMTNELLQKEIKIAIRKYLRNQFGRNPIFSIYIDLES